MSDLYLICHKVRNEPAFDVAMRIPCVICQGTLEFTTGAAFHDCFECDELGYWWIIPTSGHRAYPFWSGELPYSIVDHPDVGLELMSHDLLSLVYERVGSAFATVPDHYPNPNASTPSLDLVTALGLIAPAKPFLRRI
jgi:hypothetical protein